MNGRNARIWTGNARVHLFARRVYLAACLLKHRHMGASSLRGIVGRVGVPHGKPIIRCMQTNARFQLTP